MSAVIRAEHRFRRTHMPIDTIIWPWWYGAILFAAFACAMLGLAMWLGRDTGDDD